MLQLCFTSPLKLGVANYHALFVSLKQHAHWSGCCTEHDLETSLHHTDALPIGQYQRKTGLRVTNFDLAARAVQP